MSANDNLPVILVSAVDIAAASELITEIINEDIEPPQCNGAGPHEGGAGVDAGAGRVWQMCNKYYSAEVRLRALPDGAVPDARDDVQAHVIYLTEDEGADAARCGARAGAVRPARGAVRLVAARLAREPRALREWALARRYEPVALLQPRGAGPARLRDALQAHAWPGLRRVGAVLPPPAGDSDGDSSGDEWGDEWGAWTGAGAAGAEAAALARAEQFADLLALLPARAGAGAGPGPGPGPERRLHAEQLVAAFCRALGHELRLEGDGEEGGQGQGERNETPARVDACIVNDAPPGAVPSLEPRPPPRL